MDTRKLLLIEDDSYVSMLIQQLLTNLHYSTNQIIACTSLHDALQQSPAEISFIIVDLTLPDSPAADTFERVYERFSYIPIIVISAMPEAEFAMKTIQSGAQDYIIKSDLDERTLERAIRYAAERKKNINDYERLFDESPVPMYIYELATYRFLAVNEACIHQYGYSRQEFLTMTAEDIRPKEDVATFHNLNIDIPEHYHDFGRWTHIKKNGQHFVTHIYAHATVFNGKQARLVTAIDIDKSVHAECKLQEQNSYLKQIAWMHSHEARGPVANILGLTSLLNMNEPNDPENQIMLELIAESATQLDTTIRKIAAYIDDYEMKHLDDED